MVFSDLRDSGYFEAKESTWDCEKCENETLLSEKLSLIAMNCWKLLIYPENKEKSDKIKIWIKAYPIFVFYFIFYFKSLYNTSNLKLLND